jgi:hypothetical protein
MPEVALELIKTGCSLPGQVNKKGNTALMWTCIKNIPEVALKLINTGLSKPDQVDDYGNTALIWACHNSMKAVALELINTGLSKPDHIDRNGNTALIFARNNSMQKVISKLTVIDNGHSTELTWTCYDNISKVGLKLSEKFFAKFGIELKFPERPYCIICPISIVIMKNPVITEDGHTYDRSNIEKWFENSAISPMTGKIINKTLISNIALRNVIFEYQKSILFTIPNLILNAIFKYVNKKSPYDYIICCPISKKIMKDPVVDKDGHTYDRSSIEE